MDYDLTMIPISLTMLIVPGLSMINLVVRNEN